MSNKNDKVSHGKSFLLILFDIITIKILWFSIDLYSLNLYRKLPNM